MKVEEVELIYDPATNVTTVHVKGLKGKDCTKVTEGLEKALGGKIERHTTREYNEAPVKAGVKVGG